jgi:nicotinate phosphoribosyltransferase
MLRDSRWARRELDAAGWRDVKIFASGDLDEMKIAALLRRGAKLDAFGVGTALATPMDAPNLNLIYKLVEVERGGKVHEAAKFSRSKATYPGRKQVFRFAKASGEFRQDTIAHAEERLAGGEPLLIEVMRGGRRILASEPVSQARARCLDSLSRLPEKYRQLGRAAHYPVHHSARLKELLEDVKRRVRLGGGSPQGR